MFLGTAAYAFEGVGLVLPIASSMLSPRDFPLVASAVMGTLLFLFLAFGVLGLLAFGPDVKPTILLNLSLEQPASPAATIIEILYTVIIICTFPLMLLPAIQILERYVHWHSCV